MDGIPPRDARECSRRGSTRSARRAKRWVDPRGTRGDPRSVSSIMESGAADTTEAGRSHLPCRASRNSRDQAGDPGRIARRGGGPDPPHRAVALAADRPAVPDRQDPGQPRQAGPPPAAPEGRRGGRACWAAPTSPGGAVGLARAGLPPRQPTPPRDLAIDIGTAGSTGLVLQTLHLPLALRAESAVRVVLTGGTFNPKAPAVTRSSTRPGAPTLRRSACRSPWRCRRRASIPGAAASSTPGSSRRRRAPGSRPTAGRCGGSAASPASPTSATTIAGGCATEPSSGWPTRAWPSISRSRLAAGPARARGPRISLIAEHDRRDPRHVRRPGRARQAGRGGRRRGRRRAARLRGRRRRRGRSPLGRPDPPAPGPGRRPSDLHRHATSPSTSAPTPPPSAPSSTAPSRSRSPTSQASPDGSWSGEPKMFVATTDEHLQAAIRGDV